MHVIIRNVCSAIRNIFGYTYLFVCVCVCLNKYNKNNNKNNRTNNHQFNQNFILQKKIGFVCVSFTSKHKFTDLLPLNPPETKKPNIIAHHHVYQKMRENVFIKIFRLIRFSIFPFFIFIFSGSYIPSFFVRRKYTQIHIQFLQFNRIKKWL